MEIKIENVEALRLFGSYARGEESEYSDYDILVVLNKSQVINEHLKEQISTLFEREISISWYSKERIELLFKMGHLFAWHLYLESKAFNEYGDFILNLGVPKPYAYYYEDVWSLLEILKPIKQELLSTPRNIVYEMGIAYVCARNIAICALPMLKNKYSFSVTAPFDLDLGISHSDFDMMVKCRYASSRGLPAPDLNIDYCINLYKAILEWGTKILHEIKKKTSNGN